MNNDSAKGIARDDREDTYPWALASLTIAAPSLAASKPSPMGIALGNVQIGDYGRKGTVTAAFDPDGTVGLTFPDGTKRRQAWIAERTISA